MQVVEACELLDAMRGAADFAGGYGGAGDVAQIAEMVGEVVAEHEEIEIGVHLHARRGCGGGSREAAYAGGCRRFDAAIGGLGGCPFAQDALVGNIPTETLLAELKELGRVPSCDCRWT